MVENLVTPITSTVKIMIGGSGGIGKTTLLTCFCEEKTINETKVKDGTPMTIGVEFSFKTLFKGNRKIQLKLWDLGGQMQFRFILEDYCKGAKAAMVCFDITRIKSFRELDEWVRLIKRGCGDVPILLVSTKYDMEYRGGLTKEMATEYATKNGFLGYIETSSFSNLNIRPFEVIINHLIEKGVL